MTDFRVQRGVRVLMRDGAELSTDVWLPDGAERMPAVLARLPYGKESLSIHAQPVLPNLLLLVAAGYAVVVQDTRGTGASDGPFEPLVHEADDGADTVSWIVAQPWSDGAVGMTGASYVGWTQWETAATGVAGLRALAPALTTTDYYRAPWYSEGGAFSLEMALSWTVLMATAELAADPAAAEELARLHAAIADRPAFVGHLPLRDQPLLAGPAPWYREWLDHPERDGYWRALSVQERAEAVTVPALQVGGWFDLFLTGTLAAHGAMRARAGSAAAREGQRLVIGPWDHINHTGSYVGRDFGALGGAAAADLTAAHVAFYDTWLRGRAAPDTAPVRLFVMGIDQWRDEAAWPLPDTEYTDLHLGSGGHANTAAGDGRLSLTAPAAPAVDSYRYDPLDPVPTVGGRTLMIPLGSAAGPLDQAGVEARPDVLCYTGPVLEAPLEVTGPVSLVLHVSSDAVDTDVTAKLVDVFPDGRALYLTDGVLRLRYREGLDRSVPLTPGEVYQVTVDVGATANVFLPGHRVRLEVSSSNAPRFDRNTNTGGVIAAEGAADCVVATNRVHTGPAHPSRLVLPLIRR